MKFSVSMCVYGKDNPDWFRIAVDSVLNQTYQDFEILLIDDGSTDGSGEICSRYVAKDSRIRYIKKENGGQENG